MNSIQRELGGQDLRLAGALTVTTTDSLLHCLTPMFSAFQQQYPDIGLRLLSDTRPLDLMQRDADIAVRPTNSPPEHWIGRNLTTLAYAAYALKDYLDSVQDLPATEQRWVRLNDSLNQSPMSQITAKHKPEGAPVTISNSLMGVFELVRCGLGFGALPCYLGEAYPDLVRVHDLEEKFSSNLWMLAHPDIRRSARVHAFFEFATARIRDELTRTN